MLKQNNLFLIFSIFRARNLKGIKRYRTIPSGKTATFISARIFEFLTKCLKSRCFCIKICKKHLHVASIVFVQKKNYLLFGSKMLQISPVPKVKNPKLYL